jgi:hypothetical protein
LKKSDVRPTIIRLLGTGTSVPDPMRSAPSIAINVRRVSYLISGKELAIY